MKRNTHQSNHQPSVMGLRRIGSLGCIAIAMLFAANAMAQGSGQVRLASEAYPTGNPSTSVILLERFAPSEIRAGSAFDYTIKLTNLTTGEVNDLILTERLADGFAMTSMKPEPKSSSGGTATWHLGTIKSRESKTLTVSGSAAMVGELSSCATVTFTTQVCSKITIVQPALEVTKTLPQEVMLCDPIPMTVRVTNSGSGLARNVVVKDQLPSGWTTMSGQSEIMFQAGNLPSGVSREFSVDLKAANTGTFENCVEASEDGGLTARSCASTRITKPELTLTKTGPSIRYLGRGAQFEITATNVGDAVARNTVLTDALPSGLRFVRASENGQFGGGRVTWNLGSLDPGASRTVTVDAMASSINTFTNKAEVRSVCANANAEAMLEVRGIPAILLEVIDVEDPIEVGSVVTYIITVTNQGSAVGTNISLKANLPAEQSFVSGDGPTAGTANGQQIEFAPLPSLAPKAKATYRVVVKGTATGDVRFRVSMISDQMDSTVDESESTRIY
ncbi:MAG: hypothetical protein DHS20C16_18360 [Phycisphaerae bacterium]|nr:MAG: hypothetical protein DHS20C16_18360 [Phycisphaerae bacterium]